MAEEKEISININPHQIKSDKPKEEAKRDDINRKIAENHRDKSSDIYLRTWGILCINNPGFWPHELYEKLKLWDQPHPVSYKIELEREILKFVQTHAKDIRVQDHYQPPTRPYIPARSDGSVDEKRLKELLEQTPPNWPPNQETLEFCRRSKNG